MSDYHLNPLTTLPSIADQEAKEKRRRELDAVRHRGAEAYKRLRERVSAHHHNAITEPETPQN